MSLAMEFLGSHILSIDQFERSDIEKILINLLHNSGYPAIKIEKKVDFEELYKKNFN